MLNECIFIFQKKFLMFFLIVNNLVSSHHHSYNKQVKYILDNFRTPYFKPDQD